MNEHGLDRVFVEYPEIRAATNCIFVAYKNHAFDSIFNKNHKNTFFINKRSGSQHKLLAQNTMYLQKNRFIN